MAVRNGGEMKKAVAVMCLMLAIGLIVGCGSSSEGKDITGTWVYQGTPEGQGPILVFGKDGTLKISVPSQTNPEDPEEVTETQTLNLFYETGSDAVKLWRHKEAMKDQPPSMFFLIYKDTLMDTQGGILVRQGSASQQQPTTPPVIPTTPNTTSP